MDDTGQIPQVPQVTQVSEGRRNRKDEQKNKKKRTAIIIGAVVALALIIGLVLAFVLMSAGAVGTTTQPVKIRDALVVSWRPKAPESFFAPLSGVVLAPEAYLRRPLVVKVENEPPARPQSGLDRADVIYEVPMEGFDVTRYIAIYQSRSAATIGPIRSARFADVEVVPQYKGIFAHCGGVWAVLQAVKKAGIADLDQYFNDPAYWRVGFRSAPHNLYTSTALLWSLARRKGMYKPTRLPSFGFKDEERRAARPVATVKIPYGDVTDVRWEYSRKKNAYLRFQEGSAHTDNVTGAQLVARNLILLHAKETVTDVVEDVAGSKSLKFNLVGSGRATIFVDGKRINGKWRAGRGAPPVFSDAAGRRALLNRGNVWIEIVPPRIKPTIG